MQEAILMAVAVVGQMDLLLPLDLLVQRLMEVVEGMGGMASPLTLEGMVDNLAVQMGWLVQMALVVEALILQARAVLVETG